MKPADANKAEFDEFARRYEALFKPWLKIAGAPREYFARSQTELVDVTFCMSQEIRTEASDGLWLWHWNVSSRCWRTYSLRRR